MENQELKAVLSNDGIVKIAGAYLNVVVVFAAGNAAARLP